MQFYTHTHTHTYAHTYTYTHMHTHTEASQVSLVVKNLPANTGNIRDAGLTPGSGRSLGGKKWHPTPVFLLEEFHKQRSLVVYSL